MGDGQDKLGSRSIETDTIFYTGYKQIARSCWLKITPLGREEQSGERYCCTTRNGFLCREHEENLTNAVITMDVGVHQDVDPELNDDPRRLMDQLANLWERYEQTATYGPYGYHVTGSRVPPLHYFYSGYSDKPIRPRNREPYNLSEDTLYKIQMDWAFPYVLHAKDMDSTKIFPFGMAQSKVNNRDLNPAAGEHWNDTYIVRFKRSDNWESDKDYHTEVLNPSTQEVAYTLSPPTRKSKMPAWMKSNGTHRARLMLPHNRGFLLLQKLFFKMMDAYNLLNNYVLAKTNFDRDASRLKQIEHIFELLGCSTGDSDIRTKVSHAFQLIEHFKGQLKAHQAKLNDAFRQLGCGSGIAFRYLMDFFSAYSTRSSGFIQTQERDWYQFTHFLGPLTFLELAVWLIRQSPLKEDFYAEYGEMIYERSDGMWEGADSQRVDPMLVDTRFVDNPQIPGVRPAMSWTKRSVKVYASVNQMFCYNHVYHIWTAAASIETGELRRWGILHEPGQLFTKIFPNTDDVKEFIRFIAKESNATKFNDTYASWISERWSNHLWLTVSPDEIKQRVNSLQFANRANCPSLASSIDAFQRAFSIADILTSVVANDAEWTDENIASLAYETLHLADATAKLLGAAGKTAFKFGFAPILGAIDFGRYTYKTVDAILADDPFKATMYGLQAVASAAATGSMYIAGTALVSTPGGYVTLPWAAITAGASAVVYLGAEVALWIDENLNEDFEKVAEILWDKILEDEKIVSNLSEAAYEAFARRPVYVNATFNRVLSSYFTAKKKWADCEIDNRSLNDEIDDLDDYKNDGTCVFPQARWQYLEKGDTSAAIQVAYDMYCRSLNPNWTIASPPPRLPYFKPEPSGEIE